MHITRQGWMTGVAVIAALGIGLGVGFAGARQTDRTPANPHAGAEDHEDEGGEAGFVALSPEAAGAAGVALTTAQRGGGADLRLPGRVAFAPSAEAAIDAPLSGTVLRVHVGPGDRVRTGTPLATLRSSEGASSRAGIDAAVAAVEVARAAERRDRTLFQQGWVAQARLDVTAAETRRTEADLRQARARGAGHGDPGSDGVVVVRSPIGGLVTRVSVAPGQFLHEEALQVAAVSDPSRLELVFEAPPGAAGLIRIGDRLDGGVAGNRTVSGVVTAIAPANAAGVVILRARPTGEAPPAGTVLSGRILSDGGQGTTTVPLEAVQTVDGVASIFVAEGAGFRARPVVTGRAAEGRIEILRGLNGGERIAGAGAFLLKAELAKGEAEHGH